MVGFEEDDTAKNHKGVNGNKSRVWEMTMRQNKICKYKEHKKIMFIQIRITKVPVIDSTKAALNHP